MTADRPPAEPAPADVRTVVVMGVSGSGKTTVAQGIAAAMHWPMAEGDEFHPAANVEKMRSGTPLTDEDRWPWLGSIARWIGEREQRGVSSVVTCSALKRAYRDVLRSAGPSVVFLHLDTRVDTIRSRVEERQGHYMPPSLLDSQVSTLEPLEPDEPGVRVDASGDPAVVVRRALDALGLQGSA